MRILKTLLQEKLILNNEKCLIYFHFFFFFSSGKNFKNKQVILLSNFDNSFEDNELNSIIAGMKKQGTELNVM